MAIKVRYNGLEIDGNLLPLFSGSFHYWRSAREDWAGIFDQVKALGFGMVETYVPWAVHELAEGEFDFGRQDERKDLDAWLTLAAQKGLKAILRPGPCINSELPDFGYPERILHDPAYYALDGQGAPVVLTHQTSSFAVPSYANERLFEQFDVFLSDLAPIIQKHLHPHGCVVALQVDNELGYFFRTGAYDMDYSEAALKLWAHFLDLKYRKVGELNKAWGVKLASFDEAPAPRRNEAKDLAGLRACVDWVEYKEYQILWGLTRLAELYRSRGLGSVPFFHNFYGPWTTPYNVAEIEADAGIDFCGLDSYPHADSATWAVDQARYLVNTSRLAYFPEYGAGSWPFGFRVRDEHDQASTMLAPIMGGARGVNFYMLVERERWLGSPLDVKGRRREAMAGLYERFNTFLKESDWLKAAPQNQGLLLHSREAQWHQAAFDRPLSFGEARVYPVALHHTDEPSGLFGEGQPGWAAQDAFREAAKGYADSQHFSYGLADNAIATDKLKRHAFCIATLAPFIDEGLARHLRSYVEEGGQLIVGPAWPARNARFEALKAFDGLQPEAGKPLLVGDGRILWLPEWDEKAATAFLRKGKVFADIALSDPTLQLALHKAAGRSLVFVRNPHGEARKASVLREGKFVLKPLWASGKFLGGVEEREVSLEPHEIKVWELIPVS
jgi:beta-galactosidase